MTVAGVASLRAEVDELLALGASNELTLLVGGLAEVSGDEPDAGLAHVAPRAIEALASMQVPVAGDLLRRFGDRGQHPTHLWADGLVYDCLVYRCFDLGVGPVLQGSIEPATAWFLSALPQVALDRLHPLLDRPFALRIGAPVSLAISLWRIGDGVAIGNRADGPSGRADGPSGRALSIDVDAVGLLRFGSGRSSWRDEGLVIAGPMDEAAAVLDEMRI